MSGNAAALAEDVHALFIKNHWTLSLAESCTGGALSAQLTAIPGCSQYFLGSIISYSNELKSSLLKVPNEVILEHGAVSREVALYMASGMLIKAHSDVALAVTGIAGPTGGTPEKPVGTVWLAIARQGHTPVTWNIQARGSRQNIIACSVEAALTGLLQHCQMH